MVPSEVAAIRWHWGALVCNWAWLFAHGQKRHGAIMLFFNIFPYLFLLIMLLGASSDTYYYQSLNQALVSRLTFAGTGFCGLLIGTVLLGLTCIPLARRASSIAWQSRRFDSIEHFLKVQEAWSRWGIRVLIAMVCAPIVLFMLAAAVNTSH